MQELDSTSRHHYWQKRPNHLKIILREGGTDHNVYKKKAKKSPEEEELDKVDEIVHLDGEIEVLDEQLH